MLRDLTHPGRPTAGSTCWSPRSAACCSRWRPGLGDLVPVELQPGDAAELDDVARALVDAAYTRVELVEKRGEFAVRGGLLDVFPPTEPHPVRVEFWGDEVDELRYFSAADQRSLDERPERLWAPPCRELLLTAEVRERAARAGASSTPSWPRSLGKLAEGIAVEGMESLIPALIGAARGCSCSPTWCPRHPRAGLRPRAGPQPGRGPGPHRRGVPRRLLVDRRGGRAGADRPGCLLLPRPGRRRDGGPRPRAALVDHRRVHPGQPRTTTTHVTLDATGVDRFAGDVPTADRARLRGWARDGWRVVLTFAGPGPAQRAADQFAEADLGVRLVPDIAAAPGRRA